jgi:hypothetical protein
MRLPLQFATSLRQRILDAELLTEVELDEALSECEEIARNPETFVMSFLVTQVWGRKRVDSCVYCAREKSMGLEQAVAAKGHKGALLFAEASLDEWLDGAGEIVGSDGLVFPIESQIIMARKEILRASRCLRCAEACRQNTRLRKRTARSVHDGQEWSWGRASEERTWI